MGGTKRTKRRTFSRSSTSIAIRGTTAKSSVSYRYRHGYFGAGAVGNEPHHIGSASPGTEGRWPSVACSAFCGARIRVFFFDVTQPLKPRFISSNNPSTASITDEFAPLSTGGFLATFMGGPAGAHPGRVLEYDANLNVVQTLPTPTDDVEHPFNPHGISIDEAHNLMVTSDYVCPVSTLHIGGGGCHT